MNIYIKGGLSMPGFTVIFAVYGALVDGDPDNCVAADVSAQLQRLLDVSPNGLVRIDNATLGVDPAPGNQKHFGAIIEFLGQRRPFACVERQSIDFS